MQVATVITILLHVKDKHVEMYNVSFDGTFPRSVMICVSLRVDGNPSLLTVNSIMHDNVKLL